MTQSAKGAGVDGDEEEVDEFEEEEEEDAVVVECRKKRELEISRGRNSSRRGGFDHARGGPHTSFDMAHGLVLR